MSMPSQNKTTGVRPKPPDKGSFPIDHFDECTDVHDSYMKCLRRNKNDNMSCRYIAKEYLQCRMSNNLMAQETMTNLGFTEEDDSEKQARKRVYLGRPEKEQEGWLSARDAIEKRGWVKPSVFGSEFGMGDVPQIGVKLLVSKRGESDGSRDVNVTPGDLLEDLNGAIFPELIQDGPAARGPAPSVQSIVSRTDKLLVIFIQSVFACAVAYMWNRLRSHPQDFDSISIFLLIAFSLILGLSIFSLLV